MRRSIRGSTVAACVIGVLAVPAALFGQGGQARSTMSMPMLDSASVDSAAAGVAHRSMDHPMLMASAHMRMTPRRPPSAADSARADEIVDALRDAIAKYRDYHVALADGYRIFLPNVPQPVYHFTSWRRAMLAAFSFDPTKPTSLLYRKTTTGYELVGAMYTAPYRSSLDALNARVPLSVAQWHLHTNLCLPPRGERARWTQQQDGQPLFGPRGSITTAAECAAHGGRFYPHLFGWMVHVNPWATADEVWGANTHEHPSGF